MPVKEKDEVLAKDIREDLASMRSMAMGDEDISKIDTYNFEDIRGMYKNQQQQITFVRRIYSEIIQEVLGFMSRGHTVEAMINLCILDRMFCGQNGDIGIETGLDCVEAINQYIHGVCKRDTGDCGFVSRAIRSGAHSWNRLKTQRAIHVCATPFLDDNQNLASIEQELEAMSRSLGE